MLRLLRWVCRFLITLGRSIHELVWALFFLSALGDAPIAACSALALPFAGTLGKVFSELIDEQSQDSRSTLMATGASPLQAFVSALFPSAVPEMLTYTVYRFECALRSSAVLGFIGVETVGLGIRQSYESLYYGEVWTQLYALVIVVVGVDVLGARLRERLNRGATRKAVPELSKLESGRSEARLRRTAPRDWIVRGGLLAGMMLV
jgi:phosphonate transport system permease protein